MKIPKDPRSTQRKRARKVLFKLRVPFVCVECEKSPISLPVDAPKSLELAPLKLRTVSKLECNHINKNIFDNDPVNLEWLCPRCHKLKDSQTQKGVSVINDEFGFGIKNIFGT